MISVAEALAKVVEGVSWVSTEQVPLPAALGRVLAEDVSSRVSHPPVAVSAMDGYAVRSDDVENVPVTLKRIGQSAAGAGYQGSVGRGETVRIFTGAPVPDGADESENQLVRTWGEKPEFDFKIRNHVELGEDLGLLDMKRAAKISSTRFAVYK